MPFDLLNVFFLMMLGFGFLEVENNNETNIQVKKKNIN